jgi:hypothetical protein
MLGRSNGTPTSMRCAAWHLSEEVTFFICHVTSTFKYSLRVSPTQILAFDFYDEIIKLYIDDATEGWYCFARLAALQDARPLSGLWFAHPRAVAILF